MNPYGDGPSIQPGDRAPDFTLPWIEEAGSVSLADYRGTGVLFALVRGLWCPFCRRALANLAAARQELNARGIESFGVVATEPDNARLYLRYRPSKVPLAADPAMRTHAVYGLPRPEPTPELFALVTDLRTDAGGELPEALPFEEASAALNRADDFSYAPGDAAEMERGLTQLTGHFLVDGEGIVRWTDLECARDGIAGLGSFPRTDELLAAATRIG